MQHFGSYSSIFQIQDHLLQGKLFEGMMMVGAGKHPGWEVPLQTLQASRARSHYAKPYVDYSSEASQALTNFLAHPLEA